MPKGTYQEQVQAMLDTRLSVAKRIGFALLALVGLWTAGGFSAPAFTSRRSMDEEILYRLPMIFSFLLSVAWMALTGWAALRGVVRRTHRPWIAATTLAMGFVYIVTLMFIFATPIAQEESRAVLGTQYALIGFFLLNTIGLCAILGVLYRGQFRSQEKLLEIQYRLAELAEKVEKRQAQP
jgi:hypothetical protein